VRSLSLRGSRGQLFGRRTRGRAVEELSRSLTLIVDRGALEASVAARIKELFDPDRLVLLGVVPGTELLAPGFASGLAAAELAGVQLSTQGRLARWLSVNETCLELHHQPEVLAYLDECERELLTALRMSACAPLISRNRLIGLILLGSDRRGWQLGRSEIELLTLFASQASLAFENADLYRAQEERLDRLHRAERLAAVGQLAGGVAHEIRNPLTAIRSTLQYLLQGFPAGEPKHELIREVLGEVDRINGTISGLLSLGRTGESSLVPLDLLEPLTRAQQLVGDHAREHGVRVEIASCPPELRRIRGDADQLRQVFVNLLLNAVQAMREGGEVWVTLDPAAFPAVPVLRPWIEVRIVDQGPGIPPDALGRVFEPFFTTKREGTGLGLAICHSIVEQHRGEIRLESAAGTGTTVTVRFPRWEMEDGEDPDHR
jgi:two-component system, NtrC family, sensor kinase